MVSDSHCAFYFPGTYNATQQLCIGNHTGAVDTCSGDSGGPVVAALSGTGDRWAAGVQVGVTSYGDTSAPVSVYVRVSAYARWIRGLAPDVRDASAGERQDQ